MTSAWLDLWGFGNLPLFIYSIEALALGTKADKPAASHAIDSLLFIWDNMN